MAPGGVSVVEARLEALWWKSCLAVGEGGAFAFLIPLSDVRFVFALSLSQSRLRAFGHPFGKSDTAMRVRTANTMSIIYGTQPGKQPKNIGCSLTCTAGGFVLVRITT